MKTAAPKTKPVKPRRTAKTTGPGAQRAQLKPGESARAGALDPKKLDLTESARADEALRESEETYARLVTDISDGVFVTDDRGVLTFVNPALARILGLNSPDQLVGRNFMEFVAPSMLSEVRAYFQHAIQSGRTRELTVVEVLRADGRPAVVEIKSMPIMQSGKVTGTRGVLRDITARQQAEHALKASESHFRSLFENMLEGYAHCRMLYEDGRPSDFVYLDVNHAFEDLTGLKNVVGKRVSEVIPGIQEANPELFETYGRVAAGGHAEQLETYVGGLDIWFSISVFSAKIGTFVAVFENVSERKRAEAEQQQRALELRALYETSLEVIGQSSLDELLSSIVRRAAALLGTHSGVLYLMQPDGQSLKLLVGHNFPPELIDTTLKLGEGLSGQVAQTGMPVAVEDYQTWPGRAAAYGDAHYGRVLGIPLKVKDKIIGVINVTDNARTGSFSEDQVRLGTLFADQAALAIESARLYEQERSRRRELQTLSDAALAISSDLSLDLVLKAVVQQATKAIRSDGCAISFLDTERDALVTRVDFNAVVPVAVDSPGKAYPLKDYPATRRALEGRVPSLLSTGDPQADPAEAQVLASKGMRGVLLVPLVARDRVIGLMELYRQQEREPAFTEDEIRLTQSLSAQTAVFIENARLFEAGERRLRRTLSLQRIDEAIAGGTDVNFVLSVILEQALPQLAADAATVLLYEPAGGVLAFAVGRGFQTQALQHTRLPRGQGYAGRAALGRRIEYIADLRGRTTDFLRSPTFAQEGFVSYYAVPLIAKGEIKGVLEVFYRLPFEGDLEWNNFLASLGGVMAIAIDNATLFRDLQISNTELSVAYDATIEGWSRAMDLRDKETEGHTRRVAEMTLKLGRVLGLPEEQLVHMRRGALLHDIGKMGVPDAILLKPGPLTEDEWGLMKQHPTLAYQMLSSIQYLRAALDIPYCHHEKWDGTGYPRGLQGEQIPLSARIFAVVDVYDALTSDRPYRKAWSRRDALNYITGQNGRPFDPKVVDAFLREFGNE